MRKPFLLLAATAFTLPAVAQTERGATMIGLSTGNLQYSRADKGNNDFAAALYPSAGYFVVDNLALGAGLTLGYDRQRSGYQSYSSTLRILSYGISPFARYYVVGQGKHQVFGEAGYDFRRSHLRYVEAYSGSTPDDVQKSRVRVSGWHAGLGYNYFLTPNAALEASANYSRGRNTYDINSPFPFYRLQRQENALNIRLGFTIFLASGNSAR